MRVAALPLIALAGLACARRTLQADDAGGGPIAPDAAADAVRADINPFTLPDAAVRGPDASCGALTFRSRRIPSDIMLVVDRAVSNDAAKWNEMVTMLARLTTERNMEISWGLKLFPENGFACGPGSVTDRIDVPIALRDAAAINTALAAATPTAVGNPTGVALTAARTYLDSVADESPKFLMLVSDGTPDCTATGSVDPAQALADTVALSAANLAGGIPTFVVGVGPAAARDVDALNRIAAAGGVPRAGQTMFYPSSSVDELIATLGTLVSVSYTCALSLAQAPPNATVVGVTVNGAVLPHDTTHQEGWDYIDSTHSALMLYGSACNMIPNSWELEVQIFFACAPPPTGA